MHIWGESMAGLGRVLICPCRYEETEAQRSGILTHSPTQQRDLTPGLLTSGELFLSSNNFVQGHILSIRIEKKAITMTFVN